MLFALGKFRAFSDNLQNRTQLMALLKSSDSSEPDKKALDTALESISQTMDDLITDSEFEEFSDLCNPPEPLPFGRHFLVSVVKGRRA